jgi:hypothetical protein
MGGLNLPQQQEIPANLTEEQNAQRIQDQGMSDQGIVSLGEGLKEAKGLYKDVKKAIVDPAIDRIKGKAKPAKSVINMTAEEAMKDL